MQINFFYIILINFLDLETILVIFLSQVPGNRMVIPKPGNELTIVQLPLTAEGAIVEEFFVFCFLGKEVQHDALTIHMVENDVPLIEF